MKKVVKKKGSDGATTETTTTSEETTTATETTNSKMQNGYENGKRSVFARIGNLIRQHPHLRSPSVRI